MQELINKVKETAGINDDQAFKSIDTIATYLKSKMPKSFHSQIDNMINGGKLSEGIKEKLVDAAVDAKDKTEDALKDLVDKIEDAGKKVREMWEEKTTKKKPE